MPACRQGSGARAPGVDLGQRRERHGEFQPLLLGVLLTAATAAFALLLALERSPFGTGLRANRDSEQRSLFLSTAAFAYKSTCLVISAAVSGFAGGMFVTQFGFVTSTLLGLPLPRRLRRAGTGTPAATR